MSTAFTSSELLSVDLLHETFAGPFFRTLVAELAVGAVVLVRHVRAARSRSLGPAFRLAALRRSTASGWWVLPIHVWAVDACALAGEVMFGGGGLVDPPFSYWVLRLYQAFLALGCLVLFQGLLVAVTRGPVATLGVEGKARSGAVAAILGPTIVIFVYLCVVRWAEKAANGALPY
jgi:hypothetical protein